MKKLFLLTIIPLISHATFDINLMGGYEEYSGVFQSVDENYNIMQHKGAYNKGVYGTNFTLGCTYFDTLLYAAFETGFTFDSLNQKILHLEQQSGDYEDFYLKSGMGYTNALRAGFRINDTSALYLRFGLDYSPFTFTYINNDTGDVLKQTIKSNKWGITPGIGIMSKVSNSVSIRCELHYQILPQMKFTLDGVHTNTRLDGNKSMLSRSKTSFLVGLTYHFGSDDEEKAKAKTP